MNLINILVKNSQTNLKINPLLVQELQVVPYGTKYKARLVLTSGHNYFLTNNDQEVFDTKLEAEQLLSTVEQSILAELISSVYKPAGSLEKAEILPSLLIKANLGNVYNITETFTTTIDFVEGAGIEFAAGTNIVIIDSGNEVYKFDVLGNFVKLTAIDIDIENGAFADKTVEEALDTLSVITQNIPRIEKPVLENEIEVVLEPMGTVNTQFDMTKESIENGTLWIDDVKVVEKGVALDGYILTEIQGGYELTGGGYDIAFYYESGEYGSKGDIVDLNAKSGTLKFLVNIRTYVDYEIDKLDLGDKNVQSDWNESDDTKDSYIQNKPTIPTVPTNVSAFTNDSGYITGYTETDPIFTAWNKSTGISITKSQVSDLIEATQSLSGLMSATDKQRLDVLHALLEEDTENNVVDSINEVLAIFNNYPEGADLVTALAGKVNKVEGMGLSENDLTDTLKSNYDTAYGWGDHATENYLKSITKAMVEAVLSGTITSHDHDSHYYTEAEIDVMLQGLPVAGHTHTESDITDLDKYTQAEVDTLLNSKVDKVTSKGLSTNDYTTTEKNKLSGIEAGAEVNVQSDWNESDDTKDSYIQNKPTIPTVPTNVSSFTNDAGYLTSHQSLENYYNKTEIDSMVGDIETVLDTIMGV